MTACSNLCPEIGNETYCWGPTALECQYQSKCQNLLCNRCLKIRNSYSCCHEQCLGGCTGTLASQCVSCKEYYNSGTCVAHCPSRTIIHGGKLIPNPDFKYRLGNLCLSVCPDGFMVEGDVCVTHCSTGSMSRDGRVCVPCQDKCPKPCKITDKQTINGRKMSNLDLKSLNQLINCTILEGNLILTKDSFNPSADLTDHIPITDHRQLWALHSLREITGYIYLDLELLGDSLKNFSFLENLVKVGGYLPSARVSIMIMNSMAYFPGLRSLRQVPHGRVIFHKNPNLCYLSSLPWVNSAPISTFNTLNQTNSMQFTIIDGPSDDYCESFNYVCHPACKKEYGCWGPGPDQCVRCAYRRAGLYTCVQSCNDLSGFMSEQSEKHFRKSEKEKNYHDTSLALEAEGVCIPCHPECGKSCTGPGAHECIGSCKTAWSEGQCVSECQPTTYLNMDRRICEPCHTHCHQRQLTKQPVCTGPGRHPGKGGCNKCEKFVVQSPLNQINTELADYSPSINTVSLLCIRGDCPPGTYLTTEVVQPNTLFAKYAEIFTSVAAVCRSCHPRCSVCTAYSLLKANEQRLGCIKCNGFWLRDACVDHCPMEQTYSIWITTNGSISRKSSQENLSLDDNNVKYSGVYVRHLNGQCLACHEQCHAGCWGPGPDQCNHCLNVKVPIRFLSDNLTRIYVLNRIVEDGSTVEVNSLNLHLYHGKFICLSQCPNALYNHINNIPEMDGETLCHHSAYLSDSDHELIVHDNLYPFQYFDNHALSNNNEKLLRETSAEIIGLRKSSYYSSANGSIMHRKLKNDPIILFIIPLCILLIIFAVLIITCYRYRSNQQFIKKYEHNPLLLLKLLFCPLSLISQRFISNISGYKYQKGNAVINLSPTSYYYNNNNGENGLEVNLMPHSGTDESLLRRPSVPPSHRYPNQIVNGQKAPNLGRLIMINLDDLCLNEKSGPLGTGAFGAVYQVVTKLCRMIGWNENPDARPNFVDLYNMFKDFSRQPHLYLHSRNDSSSNTEVYCSTGDTRSRATIYPTARLSGERLRQSDQTVPSFQSMKSGDSSSPLQNSSSGSGLPNRRFDTGRRTRTSLLLPPTNLQANRIGKYPRHKRRSVGARTEYTMSTSLSVNSGIGERWSHSSFATQSHPTLIKVDETSGTGDIGHNFKINSNTPGNNRNNEQFNVGLFSTDSWASSGQPLLSSDQESSLSHLMLSNFGYTSSESRSSMAISSPSQHNRNFSSGGLSLPTESRNSEQPSVDEFTPNIQRNALPVNTSFEAAAGYVWPQWPDAIPNPEQNNSNQVNSGEMSYVLNTIDGESENTLPFLNRQLWLRRNARQRRYYLRQLQIHRSVADSSLPEQAGEDAADESSGWAEALGPNQSNPNGPQEDSDTDQGSADRYWPDPTYSPQNV
ncbi:Receptor protein-tyrosine kinase [Schistosoma japonicum]|nr:Receptor protein-tyrosine kinase [Schistosoma japonicum]